MTTGKNYEIAIIQFTVQLALSALVPDQDPQLDLTKIAFPTDRLSIKELRKLYPAEFDAEALTQFNHRPAAELNATFSVERAVAKAAFEATLGRASPQAQNEYAMDREELADSLVQYGLASGPHQAEQLIRNIEAQAVAQAKAFGPLPPLSRSR